MIYENIMRSKFCLLMAMLLMPAASIQADILIQFSDGLSTGTQFNVAENSTTTITVSVVETGLNTELSLDGLVGFGLTGTYGATSGVSGTVIANAVDPAFDTATDEDFTASALDLAGIDIDFAGDGFPMGSSIVLGQFDVLVNGAGVTEFVFDDYSALSDFATPSAVDLDPTIFANARTFGFTIATIPEPGSAIAIAGIGLVGLVRRKR